MPALPPISLRSVREFFNTKIAIPAFIEIPDIATYEGGAYAGATNLQIPADYPIYYTLKIAAWAALDGDSNELATDVIAIYDDADTVQIDDGGTSVEFYEGRPFLRFDNALPTTGAIRLVGGFQGTNLTKPSDFLLFSNRQVQELDSEGLGLINERRSVFISSDVDVNTPDLIRWKIKDATKINAAELQIKGAQFSRYHYSEMPFHNHTFNASTGSAGAHSHNVSGNTNTTGSHGHGVIVSGFTTNTQAIVQRNTGTAMTVQGPVNDTQIDTIGGSGPYNLVTQFHNHFFSEAETTGSAGSHSHNVSGNTNNTGSHTHNISGSIADRGPSGTGVSTNTGAARSYHSALQIWIDGVDRTAAVLTQLGVGAIGDGTAGDTYVTTGYDIDLVALDAALGGGVFLTNGFHEIEFRVASGGGKIRAGLEINQ